MHSCQRRQSVFDESQAKCAHGVVSSIKSTMLLARRAGLHVQLAYGYATDVSSTLSAVPFEEDDRDPRTWFLDHSFIEDMTTMFKKVNGAVSWHW